jgi:hypothetical protein
MMDLQTHHFIAYPGRGSSPLPSGEHEEVGRSAWCSAASVLAVQADEYKGKEVVRSRVDLWDIPRNTTHSIVIPSKDWQCGPTGALSAEWDVFHTERLTIRSLGREKWKASWHMPVENGSGYMRAWEISPDGTRIAISTGSAIFIAQRGHRLKKFPFAGATELFWSPDGKRLGLNWENHPPDSVPSDLAHGVAILDLATGHRRDFFEWEEGVVESHGISQYVIAWSQDSRWLIMVRTPRTNPVRLSFWAYNPAIGKDVSLWQTNGTVGNFAWHEGPPPAP